MIAETRYSIAFIPGNGIGTQVFPVGRSVADKVAEKHGFAINWQDYDWSCRRYETTGAMIPEGGLDELQSHASIHLDAVGWPSLPDHISLWGLLIPIRRAFDHLGETAAAADLIAAIEAMLKTANTRACYLGGSADTRAAEHALLAALDTTAG